MNGFDYKKKLIENDMSKVLKEWQKYSSITKEDFLQAVEWVCRDTFDEFNRETRKIGLESDRIVKLGVRHYFDGPTIFYDIESGLTWGGAVFKFPAKTEKEKIFADNDGMFISNRKVCLSARDKI
jgi:hypothetical protein